MTIRQFNKSAAKKILNKSLKLNYYWKGREWPYKDVPPRIIAEAFMFDDTQITSLTDYKLYCFNGEVKFLYVSTGLENHATARISFLNTDWTFAPFRRDDFNTLNDLPPKPKHFNDMLGIAKILSKNIPFVRVDLYEILGHVYFSEMTFYPCGGMMPFNPKEYDYEVGKMLVLPK